MATKETANQTARLREEIADLNERIGVLVNAVDDLRDEIGHLARNGMPLRDEFQAVHHVRQMALDPCAKVWNERLVVESLPSPPAKPAEAKNVGGEPPTPGFQRDLF